MKKTIIAATALLAAIAGSALGAEFQPMGALGIGGAGVARTTNAMAGYWNPAGLAFNESDFSMPISVAVGLRVSKGLADNVDKISKFTEGGDSSAFHTITHINGGTVDPAALSDVVSLLAILKDIDTKKGTVSLEGGAVVAMQIKHFAFGAFGSLEGFARSDIDTTNVLPGNKNDISGVSTTLNAGDLATLAGANVPDSHDFFTGAQRDSLTTTLATAGITGTSATNVINALDTQLAHPTGSTPTITPSQATDAITTITTALASGGSINDNRSAVILKSLAYLEFPISYGHPIDFGSYGKLGIGASIKPIIGRVYSSELTLVKNGASSDSGKITDNLTKNFKESTAVTLDLGLFYKYSDWLNVGLVAKNLTAPKFDAPNVKDQNGNLVTTDAKGNPINTADKVTLKPQVRAGVSIEALSWLTVAADLDLTNNETVLSSLDYKSRNFGGGIELHPLTWFKLRGGMYKNLSNSDVGPVATAGLTFGTKWVNLDLDGAYGLEKAQYKEKSYPKEARVQTSLNIQF